MCRWAAARSPVDPVAAGLSRAALTTSSGSGSELATVTRELPPGTRSTVTADTPLRPLSSLVALTASGTPLAAASCARPGIAGIFARTAGTWQAAGPGLPATVANRPIRVLRLAGTSAEDIALLQAGTGARLPCSPHGPATAPDGPCHPRFLPSPDRSAPLAPAPANTAWVLLAGGRAEIVSGPGAAWRELPVTPHGTAALAAGPGSSVEALAVSGGKLTVFELSPAGSWSKTQVISVPIQYGSSG